MEKEKKKHERDMEKRKQKEEEKERKHKRKMQMKELEMQGWKRIEADSMYQEEDDYGEEIDSYKIKNMTSRFDQFLHR